MEPEDGDETKWYIKTRDNRLNEYFKPYKYMRVCYFANWAGKIRIFSKNILNF